VLKGGATPWNTYSYLGQLSTDWGIDGTVATIASKKYFIWSCIADSLQSLCMASLTGPATIGQSHVISKPTNSWEKEEGQLPVNEGPAVIQKNGKTFVAFSASFCWTDKYQLGLLTLGDGKDPLSNGAWSKSGPVFSSANGNYGPGHNG
jgi:GH43 family beta-xylosidase